jgi:hypothetical protein
MSLSDISSGMSFANNYNDMINEANVQALSDATQLTAIKQEGADNTALKNEQSDNVSDYVADGEDAFGLIMSGRNLNSEMLKGIHEKGVKGYFATEGKKFANNFVKKKTGMTLDEIGEQANKAKDAVKTGAKQVKQITTKPSETLTQEAPTPEVAQTTSQPETTPIEDEPEETFTDANQEGTELTTFSSNTEQSQPTEAPEPPKPTESGASKPKTQLFEDGPDPLADAPTYKTINTEANVMYDNKNFPAFQLAAQKRDEALMDPEEFGKLGDQYPGKTIVRLQTQGGMFTEDRVYSGEVTPDALKDVKVLQTNNPNIPTEKPNLFQDTPAPATPSKPEDINQSQSTIQEPEQPQPEPEQPPTENNTNTDSNPAAPSDDTPAPPPDTPPPSEPRPQPSATNEVLDDAYKTKIKPNVGERLLDEAKNSGAGEYVGYGMKMAGALPGIMDAYEDIKDHKFEGNNAAEKWSNGLTIASTVLDFVPGLEWLGALGGVAAAGIGAIGHTEDQENLKNKDAPGTVAPVQAQLAKQVNFHALGMVANNSNNSLNLIHGSGAF